MKWYFEEGRIYSLDEKNQVMAEATYVHKANGEVIIDHTFVSTDLRGQGVAGKMMQVVAEYLKEKGLKASASCSYANAWLKKNREAYAEIVSPDIDGDGIACKIDGNH